MARTLVHPMMATQAPASDQENDAAGQPDESHDAMNGAGTRPKKPPTGEELRHIKDATDLYRSSSFKLQIDALLPNVRPKYHRSTDLDKTLLALYTLLTSLKSTKPQHPLGASRKLEKKGICVPYPRPPPTEDTNWKVAFEAPSDVFLVGSWQDKLTVKAKDKFRFGVDVAVEMPAELFQEKDYLNGRVFHKRAYYLSVIAAAIIEEGSGLDLEVMYQSVSDDPRATTLVLQPRQGSSTDFNRMNVEIRIIPVLPASSPIPLQRLSPQRGNIHLSASTDEIGGGHTPIYNTTILKAVVPKSHLLAVHAIKQDVPAFSDALTLLRVWANQRGYGVGNSACIRGFEGRGIFWASVLELLINGEETPAGFGKSTKRKKTLGKGLSSYQLFRAALDFLARHDFSNEHVFMRSKNGLQFSPQDYESHEAVFVDSTSTLNLLAGVPLSSLDMLKYDANLTLATLNDGGFSGDPFSEVFLKEKRDIRTRFDVVLKLDLSSAKLQNVSPITVLDHGSAYNAMLAIIAKSLRRGLGDRAKAIAVLSPTSRPRPLSQADPSNTSVIYIGLVLSTENAFRLVDQGPAADNTDSAVAEQFRELWGDKAELRRFKDGSIVESVVWEVTSSDERAHIPAVICRYLLGRHCGIPEGNIQMWQPEFDSILKLPQEIASLYQAAKAATGFKAALAAFDKLVKVIKGLDDQLPLAILNVSPVSSSLRYTNALVPISLPPSAHSALPHCARYLEPIELIVEFEKSGRWPDDLRAIQKIKLAFFERLATALMGALKGLTASVVVPDSSSPDIQDTARLEILTPEGWAFSARIWHDREATLLDRVIDDRPHVPKHLKPKLEGAAARERRDAIRAKEVYVRRFVHGPRHHRAVAALCHRFSAYAGTVRLVKRWLAAHWLLGAHVSVEAAELLCAAVFVGHGEAAGSTAAANERAGSPGTKERGFAMVAEMLKDWEWEKGMFVPVLSGEDGLSGEKAGVHVAGIKAGVWRVSTEFDPDGSMWTSAGPDAVVARRIRTLAEATWDCLQGIEAGQINVKSLFIHPTEDYDFVVELDRAILPRYFQNVLADPAVWSKTGKYANAHPQEREIDSVMRAGFDPAQLFFQDLSYVYKDTFKLFFDPLGGDRFGAVWDPSLKNPRPFKVGAGFSSIPASASKHDKSKDKATVILNDSAVLGEIERMGAGILKKIVVQQV